MKHAPQSGFIALISAIIITVLLLTIVSTASLGGFFGRFNILDSEFKDRSRALAEGCVDTALLRLANDPNYVGGAPPIPVGSDSCDVMSVESLGSSKVIKTKGEFQNAHTNLKVTVDATTLLVAGWEELPNF